VQTAASVNAFSDDVSVLLKSGTKRSVPSRWPDALLVDLRTLADAPPAMNLAGFGDIISMWTAPADWYLASAVGMDDSYHPAPVAMLYGGGSELLGVPARDTLLVGDRLATDIRMANEAGMTSALVLTGATGPEEALASTDRSDYVIHHLGELLPASETHRPKAWNSEGRGD
jgi:glycerol-1-phosphate dehydrogenase [NAD(P)+]